MKIRGAVFSSHLETMGSTNLPWTLFVALTFFLYMNRARGQWEEEPSQCGLSDEAAFQDRIVSGKDAVPHKYPWMVKLYKDFSFHCGGSLITERWVLTAGHCVAEHMSNASTRPKRLRGNIVNYRVLSPEQLNVELGSHYLFENMRNTLWRRVVDVVLHPDYDTFASNGILMQTNDIALLKIPTVTLSSNMTTICIPPQRGRLKDYVDVSIAGWGSILKETLEAPRTKMADVLQIATLKKIPFSACKNNANIGKHFTDVNGMTDKEVFCLLGNNTDSCRGDSGGPAFILTSKGYFVVGIISWGIGCNLNNYPGVYTQVASYTDFIRATIKDGNRHFLPTMGTFT